MAFCDGDRVRILRTPSEYTGCRGVVVEAEGAGQPVPLGHLVAIDGENGVTRPFLVGDLELLLPVRVRRDTWTEAFDALEN